MVVSLHGWDALNQQLVMLLATHVRRIPPST